MHITTNKTASILLYPLIKITEWLGVHHPVFLVKLRYFARFHKVPNLKEPHDINEKILHEKLWGDINVWAELADKYKVRDYVERCGLKDILIPLIGVWDCVDDICFSDLPDEIIFKANNGCGKGEHMVVHNMRLLDIAMAKKEIKKWLNAKNIGRLAAERHYDLIEPKVIAEKLLESNGNELVDYKIWCFNGKVDSVMVCSGRHGAHTCLSYFDKQWNYLREKMEPSTFYPEPEILISKPENLDQMFMVAEILAKPFPCVRVDLYNISGKIYFGELTFTSQGGMMDYYTKECLLEMGSKIDLEYKG